MTDNNISSGVHFRFKNGYSVCADYIETDEVGEIFSIFIHENEDGSRKSQQILRYNSEDGTFDFLPRAKDYVGEVDESVLETIDRKAKLSR